MALLTGRIVYYKNVPGDCPVKTSVSLGIPGAITKAGTLGVAGVGAASTIGLAVTHGAGLGASAGGEGAAFGGVPALAGTIATGVGLALIPLTIWGIFRAHHKIAVAREQATICDFAQAYNGWEEAVEQGISAGTISVQDAKNAVPTVESQLIQGLQGIYGDCNAACFMQKGLKALDLYAVEKLYDKLGSRVAASAGSLPGASKALSREVKRLGWAVLAGAGAAALA